MLRYVSVVLAASLLLAGDSAAQGWRPLAPVRPWAAVALGGAGGDFKCAGCGMWLRGAGHTTVVAGGLLLGRRVAVGAERRTWESWFSEDGDRSEAILGTAQLLTADHRRARLALRAGLGRERYDLSSDGGRTGHATIGGGGLALVLLPRASLSPTIAIERWIFAGHMPAAGTAPGGSTSGARSSLAVGLTIH